MTSEGRLGLIATIHLRVPEAFGSPKVVDVPFAFVFRESNNLLDVVFLLSSSRSSFKDGGYNNLSASGLRRDLLLGMCTI